MRLNLTDRRTVFLLLLIPAVLVYIKSMFYEFSPMDDKWMIVENSKTLSDWGNIGEFFTKPLAGLYFRPLFSLSLMIDFHIGKTSAGIYHFSSILYHLIAVVLVYKLLVELHVTQKASLLFSILFSVHPALVHSVAWIPGRNDTLLAVFALAAMLMLLKFGKEQKQKYLYAHLLFFMCALLTKESAVVLPVFFGLLTYPLNLSKKRQAVVLCSWLILVAAWYVLRNNCVHSSLSIGSNMLQSGQNFFLALGLYLGKSIFPVQQSVFPTLQNSSLLFGIILIVVLAVVVFKVGVKNRYLALSGILIFFILLAIPAWYGATSSLGEHYEHRLYLPLVGLLIFASQININQQSPVFVYTMSVLILVYSLKTFFRLNAYKTSDSFIEAGLKEAPDYYFFYSAKADHFLVKQDYAASIPFYNIAIAMQPQRSQLYSGRGFAYTSMGKTDLAIADFTKGIELANHPDMYLNRCLTYQLTSNYKAAYKDLEYLKKAAPGVIPDGLEKDLHEQLYASSLKEMDDKIAAEPANATLYIQRAKLLIMKNNLAEAKKNVETACKLEPTNKMFQLYLQQITSRIKP